MATIVTIQSTDGISSSRTNLNTNFANLNSDKIETSYLDTDNTLAANSDTKIPSQKAVKTYVDTGGNVNASEAARGIVEEATDTEVTAGTATGATGAKLFITPTKLATRLSATALNPVVRVYSTACTSIGDSTTQFDITNTAGSTYRYTFDGTGTDPSFSAANYPVGTGVYFNAQNFTAANNGAFVVTGSGTNYIEVTNTSGVAENNKTIGTGAIYKGTAWTKPTGLKYITVELVGAGGGGGGNTTLNQSGGGGGGGGYSRKLIATATLGTTESVIVGIKGVAGAGTGGTGGTGSLSCFGAHLKATGGDGGTESTGGLSGLGSSGDINLYGSVGGNGGDISGVSSGYGGATLLGGSQSGRISDAVGGDGIPYGGGGGGAYSGGADRAGGSGADGVVIVTEHYI